MWIFTPTAFVSLVEDRDDATWLIARARLPGDLARVFPAQANQVTVTPWADYRYRLHVHRETAAEAMAAAVRGVTYPNFKDAASARGADLEGQAQRMSALHQVWNVMADAQEFAHDDGAATLSLVSRPLPYGGAVDLAAKHEDDGLDCGFCGDWPDLCDCGAFNDAS